MKIRKGAQGKAREDLFVCRVLKEEEKSGCSPGTQRLWDKILNSGK